jgi:hypothetical protein
VRDDDWIEIVAPSARSEAELLFKRWEAEHPAERAALRDEDIRVDIIRSIDGGVLVRYRIRGQSHPAP